MHRIHAVHISVYPSHFSVWFVAACCFQTYVFLYVIWSIIFCPADQYITVTSGTIFAWTHLDDLMELLKNSITRGPVACLPAFYFSFLSTSSVFKECFEQSKKDVWKCRGAIIETASWIFSTISPANSGNLTRLGRRITLMNGKDLGEWHGAGKLHSLFWLLGHCWSNLCL